ncbi:hypothetical protein EI94DRAFT_1756242 [Lactarius quietus]|nr:hypothetical protein EI94DRAFT_1756242 [Lactarius quietus]
MAETSSSIMSSNMSFPYSVTSISSRKSRKNVLYPRRVHPSPVTVLPECVGSPDMLTWEVRYLCATLLPHSETRLLPAGIVLLRSLRPERDLSAQRKNQETRHCSELFILLTREILLKDAIGLEELEGPASSYMSRAFGSTPSTPNETAPRVETQGSERFTCVLRALCSVMDAFEAALSMIDPPAVGDEALQENHDKISQGFSVVKDLTIGQYRKTLGQNLAREQPRRILLAKLAKRQQAPGVRKGTDEAEWGAPQAITTIVEGSESEEEGDSVNPDRRSRPKSIGRHSSLPRRFLCRFRPLSWLWVKKKDNK